MQVSLVTMSRPSLRTVAPPPCLPLDIKDLLKEDGRLFDWLPLAVVCLHQSSFLNRELYTEASEKLKREHRTVQV
jgi:hypothetical protein